MQGEKGDSFAVDTSWEVHPYKGNYEEFKRKAHEKISNFISGERKENSLTFDAANDGFSSSADSDTWIFPSVQMGLFDIHQGWPYNICSTQLKRLSCVIPRSGGFLLPFGYFTQPRTHLFAECCLEHFINSRHNCRCRIAI